MKNTKNEDKFIIVFFLAVILCFTAVNLLKQRLEGER